MVSTRSSTVSATPRRLLPFVAFLTTFTIVMLLLMSMNLKAQKFHRRLNSSNPFLDLSNLSQEDPVLIEFVRKFYLQESPKNNSFIQQPIKNSASAFARYIDKIFHHRPSGIFVEVGAYSNRKASHTEWLEFYRNWTGLLVQADPRDFQTLLNHNRTKSLLAHACISPIAYVKEATFRSWNPSSSTSLFTIVKCFPLYTLINAAKLSTLDLLIVSAQGAEVLILKTLPKLSKINIRCLVVRWKPEERPQLAEFLGKRHYRFTISFDDLHVFMHEDVR